MRHRTIVRVLGLAAWVYGALVIGSPAAEEQLGKVHFPVSCSPATQAQFDRAMALLHSFFYPETVKAFTAITQTEPGCAMAYWGLAMSIRQNPLIPVNIATLKQGGEAIEKAKTTSAATPRERDWIAALDTYYRDLDTVDHKTRVLAYEKGMEHLSLRYPDYSEATIFYALALNEATELADKTYARQLKACALLEQVFAQQPDHPAWPTIHSYDYGPLAVRALPAARHYAAIAPSASHALLGELLLEVNDPAAAPIEFEASLQRVPNRFRSFSGAARAAKLAGDREQAKTFCAKLVVLADQADTDRPELVYARAFLAK